MKNSILFLSALVILFGCSEKKVNTKQFCDEIIQADRDFSKYSVEHGKNAAFEKFAADDVTFLADNTMPLVGIDLLKERQAKRSDTTFILTWEPIYARAAQSGDLGYSYGTWELKIKSVPSKVSKGTYITCWQRQPSGEWKYVLDTGQEGLGEEKK